MGYGRPLLHPTNAKSKRYDGRQLETRVSPHHWYTPLDLDNHDADCGFRTRVSV